ncbi:MAG: DedA family protein [Actinobacteria bacterium]|nr:DedA family protein [Actinomycetota bacterium]
MPVTSSVVPVSILAANRGGTDDLTGLIGWVADVIGALGSVGVGLMTLAEVFFPPIPSELVLPMAGFLAGRGRLSLVGAVIAATIGSTLGALVLYWLARAWGVERVRSLLTSLPLMEASDLDRAQDWFDRHDRSSVFIGRLIPGVRSLISLPAGFQEMPLGPFIALTAVGSALWNTLLVIGGYVLGSQWRSIGSYSDWLNLIVIVLLVGAVIKFVWTRRDRMSVTGT